MVSLPPASWLPLVLMTAPFLMKSFLPCGSRPSSLPPCLSDRSLPVFHSDAYLDCNHIQGHRFFSACPVLSPSAQNSARHICVANGRMSLALSPHRQVLLDLTGEQVGPSDSAQRRVYPGVTNFFPSTAKTVGFRGCLPFHCPRT